MQIELYKHQRELIELNPPRHLLAFDTGTGKTLTAIMLAKKNDVSPLVIVPKMLRKQWERELETFECEGKVVTKEEFRRDWNTLDGFEAVIVDECFVGGTRISTQTGSKKIEEIQVGDIVRNATGFGSVTAISTKWTNELISIHLEKNVIHCTPNHPIMTQRGWIEASKLKKEDLLLHSEPKEKNSDRDRWSITRRTHKTGSGHEERRFSAIKKLESVTVQEPGGVEVYNLSVEGHPSYVAEGILVHNCHMAFGNHKSLTFKAAINYFKKHNVQYVWALTATPYTSSPWSIYSLGLLIGFKLEFWRFRERFFREQYFGPRVVFVPKDNIEEDMKLLMSEFSTMVKMDDCFDVPEQTFITETFALTPTQTKAMRNVAQYETNLLVRFGKYHQIASGVLLGDEFTESEIMKCEKNDRVMSLIEENKKIVIFSRYNKHLEHLSTLCTQLGITNHIINGAAKDRDSIINEAESADTMVLFINTACSAGYELPSFPVMVFACSGYSFVDRKQAIGRILRANKLKKNVYIDLVTEDSVDVPVMESMKRKEDFSEALFVEKHPELFDVIK